MHPVSSCVFFLLCAGVGTFRIVLQLFLGKARIRQHQADAVFLIDPATKFDCG